MKARQTPTQSLILPYFNTAGPEAVKLYESSGRNIIEWQALLLNDILAINDEGLYVHSKFGYAVSRRNGKNEVALIREMYGLREGESILHTAHRTTTSRAAWERLKAVLDDAGVEYKATGAIGMESIRIKNTGGRIDFRTRSTKGGLGEGFDLLVIDEAQEYTDDENTALKYVVSDSKNPQTLFCGTPPTPVSNGTVFFHLREDALAGNTEDTGWAEWSVDKMTDPHDVAAWYETNPSLGIILTERKIRAEIGTDDLDFNIQRLGFWIRYNLKSAISEAEWKELQTRTLPKLTGKLHVGIKYGKDGANVSMSIAAKTAGGKIFIESVDCRSVRHGNDWIIAWLKKAEVGSVVIDGASGQHLLADAMKEAKIKIKPILPTVKEIIIANSSFEQRLCSKELRHMGQPSLMQSASNCEKRAIGSSGGFGYKSISDDADISLLDSVILAQWICGTYKEPKKQRVRC